MTSIIWHSRWRLKAGGMLDSKQPIGWTVWHQTRVHMLETNLRPCSPPRAVVKIWFFVRRSKNDVFISLQTIFRASVTQTHFNLQGDGPPTPRGGCLCPAYGGKVAKWGVADWAAALKKLFMILSPTFPRIAFRNGLCYALNSYLLEPDRFRVQPTLLSQPFCSFIGDEHAVYHWTAAEYTHLWASFLLFILGDRRGGHLVGSLPNAAIIAVLKSVEFQIRTEELPKVGNKGSRARNNYNYLLTTFRLAILEAVEWWCRRSEVL